jgi:phosphate transport system substrate-binding protein
VNKTIQIFLNRFKHLSGGYMQYSIKAKLTTSTIMLSLGILVTILCLLTAPKTYSAETINGAGATFPYPLYSRWSYQYNQITGMQLNYQSIGSGGGIQQIKAKTVDFGASDAPMKAEELNQFGLVQFPMVMGGVVPIVHLEGIQAGQLKLSSEVLVQIFLGKITKWNDTKITSLNPELKIPDKDIAVIHRADGSGTTWIFTNYLAAVSSEWKEKVGADKAVSWLTGIGGKGNEGVSSYVSLIDGGIGYVEYAYAVQNKLTYVLLQNRDGNYVAPTIESFMAAAANADWKNAPGFYMVLVNQPGKDSWPITGASFILVYKEQTNAAHTKTMLDFFDWCFKHGKEIATGLDYVPMPDNVVDMVESGWKAQITAGGKPVWR